MLDLVERGAAGKVIPFGGSRMVRFGIEVGGHNVEIIHGVAMKGPTPPRIGYRKFASFGPYQGDYVQSIHRQGYPCKYPKCLSVIQCGFWLRLGFLQGWVFGHACSLVVDEAYFLQAESCGALRRILLSLKESCSGSAVFGRIPGPNGYSLESLMSPSSQRPPRNLALSTPSPEFPHPG